MQTELSRTPSPQLARIHKAKVDRLRKAIATVEADFRRSKLRSEQDKGDSYIEVLALLQSELAAAKRWESHYAKEAA